MVFTLSLHDSNTVDDLHKLIVRFEVWLYDEPTGRQLRRSWEDSGSHLLYVLVPQNIPHLMLVQDPDHFLKLGGSVVVVNQNTVGRRVRRGGEEIIPGAIGVGKNLLAGSYMFL